MRQSWPRLGRILPSSDTAKWRPSMQPCVIFEPPTLIHWPGRLSKNWVGAWWERLAPFRACTLPSTLYDWGPLVLEGPARLIRWPHRVSLNVIKGTKVVHASSTLLWGTQWHIWPTLLAMAGVTPPTLPARNVNARVRETMRYFGRFQDGCAIRGSQFLPKSSPCCDSGPSHTALASSGTCRRSDLSGNACEGARLVLSESRSHMYH